MSVSSTVSMLFKRRGNARRVIKVDLSLSLRALDVLLLITYTITDLKKCVNSHVLSVSQAISGGSASYRPA